MLKRTCLIFCIFFYCHSGIAQYKISDVMDFLELAKRESKKMYATPLVNDSADIIILNAADSISRSTNDKLGLAVTNEQCGFYYKTSLPVRAIHYFLWSHDYYKQMGYPTRAVLCLQNIAFICEEKIGDPLIATYYTTESIKERNELRDTMGMANMYKYLGMLLGKQRKFAVAKSNVDTAVRYFSLKKNYLGVAVSYFDLGLIYKDENKVDSALYFICEAKKKWNSSNGHYSRIFAWNSQLLHLYLDANNRVKANEILQENLSILTSHNDIINDDVVEFYGGAIQFYEVTHDPQKASEYDERKSELIKKNVK